MKEAKKRSGRLAGPERTLLHMSPDSSVQPREKTQGLGQSGLPVFANTKGLVVVVHFFSSFVISLLKI